MLVVILISLKLVSVTSGESCTCSELLAALQEMENRTQGPLTITQNSAIVSAQTEELNNKLQQSIGQKIRAAKEDINAKTERVVEQKLQGIQDLLSTILSLHYNPGFSPSHPAHSCKEIYDRNTSSPSGYYWLQSESEQAIQAYCDMERTCGGVQGGWMKVMNINMSNSSSSCPDGLKTLTSPKRLCAMNINGPGCSSAYLDVFGVEYSRVCGKIIGYQQKSPDAFWPYHENRARTIDDLYVDGISLTHGSRPRIHIWTFAAALHEVVTSRADSLCPCTNIHNPRTIPIPPFVGNDYFCDTASAGHFEYKFYPDDPLWDGKGCGRLNTCCAFNNPPWFMKQLSASTHDSIEMRLCADHWRSNEDIVFETLELYVQ